MAEEVTDFTFTAALYVWDARRRDTWTFVTVPSGISAEIGDLAQARGPRVGFGSVKVEVRVGATTWLTSVFPDSASRRYALPIKRAVREANELEDGDSVTVHLRVL